MKKDQIKSLIQMLRSQDVEDRILALTIIDQHNPEDIEIPLLLCVKFGHGLSMLWQVHAERAYQYLRDTTQCLEYSAFSYQQVFAVVKEPEHLELACEYFGDFLTNRICERIPGKITITFTPK